MSADDRMNHYVCDRCGNYWEAYNEGECPACNHIAVWEFPPEKKKGALEQAAHVQRIASSPLFRERR